MREFIQSRRSAGAWLTLAGALVATVIGWQVTSTWAVAEHQTVFEERTNRLSHALETRMQIYVVALRAAAAYFDLNENVTRAEWRAYVDRLNITTHYPGIQGLGYAVALSPSDIPAHVAAVRAEGFADYRVWPETAADLRSAIQYLEPLDWRNQRALGFDMLSKPNRRAAMEQARDSGEPTTSGMVELVQETAVARQAGFLIYAPIYRDAARPLTVEQRRAKLRGWVYSPFRMDDLMRGIYGPESPDIHIRIYDAAPADGAGLLHDSAVAGATPKLGSRSLYTKTVHIAAGNRPWTVVFSSPPAFENGIGRTVPRLVLAGGLVSSVLLFISVAALSARRQALSDGYLAAQRALQEKEVLLKEVHHRVKNSLQIVVSMLTLQGLKTDERVRGELDKAVARVRAVAKIHERLYGGSDVLHVEFATYLRALCSDLQEAAPEYALRVDAAPLYLPTEQAVPLALICVELITNAVKHAHAPEHGRAIDIKFRPGEEGGFVLSVRDYGVGVGPDFSLEEARPSLGIRTIQAFALQLNALVSFEDAGPGVCWLIRMPAPAVGSPGPETGASSDARNLKPTSSVR